MVDAVDAGAARAEESVDAVDAGAARAEEPVDAVAGTVVCDQIDVERLGDAIGGPTIVSRDPILGGSSMGVEAICEYDVDLTDWVGTDDASLDIFIFADPTWPPSDAEDATVVSGVGDDARSGPFGMLIVTSNDRVFSVAPPGELTMSLDDDELTARLSAVARVVIDALG